MNYLCALAQQLNTHPAISPLLQSYPNNSIYAVGENLRYVEYHYLHNKRVHQISSVDNNAYLQQVLEKAELGASIEMLINTLIINEIEEEEASAYIKELITSQLLVSELEPAITGKEFIHQLIETLNTINKNVNNNDIHAIIQLLSNAQQQIKSLDQITGNSTTHYREIFEELKTLNTTIEENQLFQTDFYKSASTAFLDNSIQEQLTEAIEFLNKFSVKDENPNLKKFKENFYTQYEDAEIPLLQAIDPETGVGFKGKDTTGVNTLLDDLHIPAKGQSTYQLNWNNQQQLLHEKLITAFKKNEYTVTFTDDDLKDFNNRSTVSPDSLIIMFRMIDDRKIYLQNSGGSSAANLLGRFAHGDTIHQIINDITKHEQSLNEDKILAEIIHLPEAVLVTFYCAPPLEITKYLTWINPICLLRNKSPWMI